MVFTQLSEAVLDLSFVKLLGSYAIEVKADMRVLYFLEPMVFRSRPSLFEGHFIWVDYFFRYSQSHGFEFTLVSNEYLCRRWSQRCKELGVDAETHIINPFEILSKYNFERSSYVEQMYSPSPDFSELREYFLQIKNIYNPDIIIMSVQNDLIHQVFSATPVIHVEQPPIIRRNHPFRTMFDISGHQVDSMLDVHRDKILKSSFPPEYCSALNILLEVVKSHLYADPVAAEALSALDALRREGPVALFVTQPHDYPTYEGALRDIKIEDLIYSWAQSLPENWIGVPTYFRGDEPIPGVDMEVALANACPKLRFLPRHLSVGMTEILLLNAEGMVTISSTSASTGLLFKKKVVVTGKSPLYNWVENDPSRIDHSKPLTDKQIISYFGFLTNRYIYSHDEIQRDPHLIDEIVDVATKSAEPSNWYLDVSAWSARHAAKLFNIDMCSHSLFGKSAGCQRQAFEATNATLLAEKAALEAHVAELTQSLSIERDQLNALRGEIASLAAEKAHFEGRFNTSEAEQSGLTEHFNAIVAERDQLHALRDHLGAEIANREWRLGVSENERDSLTHTNHSLKQQVIELKQQVIDQNEENIRRMTAILPATIDELIRLPNAQFINVAFFVLFDRFPDQDETEKYTKLLHQYWPKQAVIGLIAHDRQETDGPFEFPGVDAAIMAYTRWEGSPTSFLAHRLKLKQNH